MKIRSLLLAAAVFATASHGLAQIKLTSPTPNADANFGFSVLVAGGVVYVGAPTADGGGTQRGEVIAYDAATGAFLGRIRSFFATDYARFGESLGIVGNRLFIGSPALPGPTYGRVYYAALPILGDRLPTQYVNAPDGGSNENFGSAIAGGLGGFLLVGAPDGPAGQGVGKVYAYDAATAMLVEGPVTLDSVPGARLGAAIAGSDQVAVFGSPLHPATGVQSGRIWISSADDAAAFVPPGLPASSSFGASVAASGPLILAGAPDTDAAVGRPNGGAAYLIDGRARKVLRKFQPSEDGGRLGESVALFGKVAAAGAPYSSVRRPEGGAVYLFRTDLKKRDRPAIFPVAPRDLGEGDHFGDTMSMDAGYLAVGAPLANPAGVDDAGAVYVYKLAAPRPVVQPKPKRVATTTSAVKISGVARGGFVAIARVEYALKRTGPFKTLRGTKRWRGGVALQAGTRKVFVRALDAAGTPSKVAVIMVDRP